MRSLKKIFENNEKQEKYIIVKKSKLNGKVYKKAHKDLEKKETYKANEHDVVDYNELNKLVSLDVDLNSVTIEEDNLDKEVKEVCINSYKTTFKQINNSDELLNKHSVNLPKFSTKHIESSFDNTSYHSISFFDTTFYDSIPNLVENSLIMSTPDNGFTLIYNEEKKVIMYDDIKELSSNSAIKFIKGKFQVPNANVKLKFKELIKDLKVSKLKKNEVMSNYISKHKSLTVSERIDLNNKIKDTVQTSNKLLSEQGQDFALNCNALDTHIKVQHPNVILETDTGIFSVTLTHGTKYMATFYDKKTSAYLQVEINTVALNGTARCTPLNGLTKIDSDLYYNSVHLFKPLGITDSELLRILQDCDVNNIEDLVKLILKKIYEHTDVCTKGVAIFDINELEHIDMNKSDPSVFHGIHGTSGLITPNAEQNKLEFLGFYLGNTLN